MALKTWKFGVAKFLETDQDIALTLSEALETGDAAYVAHALGAVARSRGMAKVAHETGLGRESLYKALSGSGNPELATVLRVAKALGMELLARPMGQQGRPSLRNRSRRSALRQRDCCTCSPLQSWRFIYTWCRQFRRTPKIARKRSLEINKHESRY